jgi:hypothetical protein
MAIICANKEQRLGSCKHELLILRSHFLISTKHLCSHTTKHVMKCIKKQPNMYLDSHVSKTKKEEGKDHEDA